MLENEPIMLNSTLNYVYLLEGFYELCQHNFEHIMNALSIGA